MGHLPDYISDNRTKYGDYVDQLYSILRTSPEAGEPHPEWIDSLKAKAGLQQAGVLDYFTTKYLNDKGEVGVLSGLNGGYDSSKFSNRYRPEDGGTYEDMINSIDVRDDLIQRIKNGIKGCCPSK
jgi:hypothetical protein